MVRTVSDNCRHGGSVSGAGSNGRELPDPADFLPCFDCPAIAAPSRRGSPALRFGSVVPRRVCCGRRLMSREPVKK